MAFWGGRFKWGGSPAKEAPDAGGDADAPPLGGPAAAGDVYGILSESLVELGLQIVREVRGPMRLWEFSWRLGSRLGMPPVPLAELSDAVKATLSTIDHDRLRVLAPPARGTGAGYVYDAADPDACPVRSSR
jgi:hypothetical protein